MGVPPDFESDADLRYTHRQDAGTDIYFVANAADRALAATASSACSGKRPELWDAVTGEIRDLPEFAESGGRTAVPMSFEPHQSFFVVFRRPAPAQSPDSRTGRPDRNFVPPPRPRSSRAMGCFVRPEMGRT